MSQENRDISSSKRKIIAIWVYYLMRAQAVKGTRFISRRFGSRIGSVYVGGYPKSGTTWISQLIAHSLDLPLIEPSPPIPITFKSLIHHHWDYHPSLDNSIYVIRDGRDVMISSYMAAMKTFQKRTSIISSFKPIDPVRMLVGGIGQYGRIIRRLRTIFGKDFDPSDVRSNLPKFIEAEMTNPVRWAVKSPWQRHVTTWLDNATELTVIKYEDMLSTPMETLQWALKDCFNQSISDRELEFTVERYSFSKVTGRKPGSEDRQSFTRKGISGDWVNYFTREAAEVFDYYAGELLIDLGYEGNKDWISNIGG